MLECGLTHKKALEVSTHFRGSLDGLLISHEHGDHARAAGHMAHYGMDLFASAGTFDKLGLRDHHRAHVVMAKQPFYVGTWTVIAFDAVHDAAEPLGFVIVSPDRKEKILFLTDSKHCGPRFKGLTHIMIECNYHDPIVMKNIEEGRFNEKRWKRLKESHFSLDTTREMLLANDLSEVKGIWLMHLSDANSDEKLFKAEIEKATGIPVTICEKQHGEY